MSEENGQQEPEEGTQEEYVAPVSQEELDAIIEKRIARERAKFADYDDVKSKLKTIEDAKKSEQEKLQERLNEAQGKLKAFESEKELAAIKDEISKSSGIPANILRGNSREEIEAHAEELKPIIQDSKKPHVKTDGGKQSNPSASSKQEAVSQLFGNNN